jgi:hypothetical protein
MSNIAHQLILNGSLFAKRFHLLLNKELFHLVMGISEFSLKVLNPMGNFRKQIFISLTLLKEEGSLFGQF